MGYSIATSAVKGKHGPPRVFGERPKADKAITTRPNPTADAFIPPLLLIEPLFPTPCISDFASHLAVAPNAGGRAYNRKAFYLQIPSDRSGPVSAPRPALAGLASTVSKCRSGLGCEPRGIEVAFENKLAPAYVYQFRKGQ